MRTRQAFTLIELLLASALTALLIGGSVGVFTAVQKNTAEARARINLSREGRVIIEQIGRHVGAMWKYERNKSELLVAVTGESGSFGEIAGADDEEPRLDEIHFVARATVEAKGTDFVEVSYFIHEDDDSGERTLMRRWQAPPDDDITMGGGYEGLSKRTDYLEFEYYDGLEWTEEWTDGQFLPVAVRITLGLSDKETSAAVKLLLVVRVQGVTDVIIDFEEDLEEGSEEQPV